MRNRSRPGPQRGASLVEYALGVSLVAITVVAAIGAMEDAGGDGLTERGDRAGSPVEDYGYIGVSAGGASGGSATTTSSTTAPPQEVQVVIGSTPSAVLAKPSNPSSSKWSATVTFSVTDAGGDAVTGAVVAGSWSESGGGIDLQTSCSSVTGLCAVVANKIPKDVATVTFTVSSVGGDNISAESLPDAITIDKPIG